MNIRNALADAEFAPYWLDPADIPGGRSAAGTSSGERLVGHTTGDLVIVGGGYTGLWTALVAKERDASLDVVVLEADVVGGAATGRNGGFCSASLTHGLANGLDRWPAQMPALERLGIDNLDAIEKTLARYGIDADWERTGAMQVATEEWQIEQLDAVAEAAARLGLDFRRLDGDEVRTEVDSPTYLAGLWDRDRVALLNPAKLAWGLAAACRSLGVRIHERTPVRSLTDAGPPVFGGRPGPAGGARSGRRLRLRTPHGGITARRVALATGAAPPLLARLRNHLIPVYDYALVTEPLSDEQRYAVGWRHRQGLGDSANRFHYYRLTADNRILWGGYDAIYHYGSGRRPEYEWRPATFATLARHFFETFPQLEDIRFSHAWGGVVDTCSRFCAFYGTAYGDRLAYSAGYTGLGVGASRFGAEVMLDLLGIGVPVGGMGGTERTRLAMVGARPIPFPPEPLRYALVQQTRRSMARADREAGRRDRWLRLLDRLGAGFDS